MAEILFLWFGIVSIIFGVDLLQRNRDIGVAPIVIGAASVVFYIVSVVTLP